MRGLPTHLVQTALAQALKGEWRAMIFPPFRAMGAEKRNSVFYIGPKYVGIGRGFSVGMIVEYTWQDCMCVLSEMGESSYAYL